MSGHDGMSERVSVRQSSPLQSCSVLAVGSSGKDWELP